MSSSSSQSTTSSKNPLKNRNLNAAMVDPASISLKTKRQSGERYFKYKVQDLRRSGNRSDANTETVSLTQMTMACTHQHIVDDNLKLIMFAAEEDPFAWETSDPEPPSPASSTSSEK